MFKILLELNSPEYNLFKTMLVITVYNIFWITTHQSRKSGYVFRVGFELKIDEIADLIQA